MSSPEPKVGDILRATRFASYASQAHPLWLICVECDGGWLEGVALCGGTDDAKPYEDGWEITPEHDTYTIIPLDELPDHVCVALAKRALTEGDE